MAPQDPPTPGHLGWEPGLVTGHAAIDAQHRGLLAQCNRLADGCAAADGSPEALRFDAGVIQLKRLVREHLAAEGALLAGGSTADVEDHLGECDEFEYLANEIATLAHFDRLELQRFLALWCLGHVTASARQLRDGLAARGQT